MSRAIVIGAGIAGIASAIRLALNGIKVEVFEANSYAGGKLSAFEQDGFRFDAGPSLFTMPQYVDELFELAGKKASDYFRYHQLDPVCHYFYEDGTRLSAWADSEKFIAELAEKTGDSSESIRTFLHRSEEIYRITNPVFLQQSLHRLKTFLRVDTFKAFLKIGKIDSLRTMNEANEDYFRDSRTIRFFNRYATYNGSDPYRAPATLNVIPHLEQHFGAYFPEGGMYAITTALVNLAEELGVKFYYNSPVDEILLRNGKASGVSVKGKALEADLVVSNMDVWFTYHKLLKGMRRLPGHVLKQERSSSALIFYWGINRTFPELGLHNIFFSEDYKEEFRQIWEEKKIYNDPTVYINISSKSQPTDAPPGMENWFVMINVPSNSGQDWPELIKAAREQILDKISRNLGADIASHILCESVLDPQRIEQRTSSFQGSLYGTSSNNRFAAFFRHPNFSSAIKDLYFVGGSVHPGGGIPLALLSAKITSGIIAGRQKNA